MTKFFKSRNIPTYKKAKEAFELNYFGNLITSTEGNITEASKIAQLSRQQIYVQLKKYKMEITKTITIKKE